MGQKLTVLDSMALIVALDAILGHSVEPLQWLVDCYYPSLTMNVTLGIALSLNQWQYGWCGGFGSGVSVGYAIACTVRVRARLAAS